MRIYIAGFYINGVSGKNINVLPQHRPTHVLESFHYIGNGRFDAAIREDGKPIFIDSGAFSMFTQGAKIGIEDYARFLHEHADYMEVCANLDAIRKPESFTWDNQKALESLGCTPLPVYHFKDDPKWLVKYLDAYDHICIGGMVTKERGALMEWLDHIWEHYLTHPDGRPRIRVHGFGLTALDLMFRYPWYSVDSTSWIMTSAMGGLFMDLPHRDIKVAVSDQSPKTKELDAHFDTLPPMLQRAVVDRIEELGYNMEDMRTNYAWRSAWNINYFERIQSRGITHFKNDRISLFGI